MRLQIETPYFHFTLRIGREPVSKPTIQMLTTVPLYRAQEAKQAALLAVPAAEVKWAVSDDSRSARLYTRGCSPAEVKAMQMAVNRVRRKPYDW